MVGQWPQVLKDLKCAPLNNRLCQTSPILIDINSNVTLFNLITVNVNKCDGSCNTIDDLYAPVGPSNEVKT